MARRIPDETLQAIRDRLSLTEVIAPYVSLKRAGRNFLGLCPFHSEKTPSFTVSDERGLYHCFGCGESGTVFTFVMKMERLEFLDAVAQLAQRAGVALPPRDTDDPAAHRREQLYAINARAERFFQKALANPVGAAARRYVEERGLQASIIERYGIGFAPAGGTVLAAALAKENVSPELAVEAGLLGRSNDGRIYDRFRGRIMFPIRDRRGRTIAFGGRTLGADQPKYLNSPESPLFRKGEGLYGVAEARDAISAAERAVLVEGYMDALLLVQEGIGYTVATLGTALTVAHLQTIKRFGADSRQWASAVSDGLNVFFFFDGDRAGRQAAARALKVCAEAGVWGRVGALPEGFDPDTYIRRHGTEATLAILDAAPSLLDWYIDSLPPGASLPSRTRLAEEIKSVLAGVENDVQFQLLAARAAKRLGVSESVFARTRAPRPTAFPTPGTVERTPQWPAEERMLVELIAADNTVAAWPPVRDAVAQLQSAELREAARVLLAASEQGQSVADVVERLPAELSATLTAAILSNAVEPDERMRVAEDCVRRIAERAARAQRQEIAADLRHAERCGDEGWRAKLVDLNQLRRREGGAG